MSKTVVESFYGKFSKFDVVRDSGTFSTSFYVYKDGKHESSHGSLDQAVKSAQEKAQK